jgi:hypothetical protein
MAEGRLQLLEGLFGTGSEQHKGAAGGNPEGVHELLRQELAYAGEGGGSGIGVGVTGM